MSPKKLPADLDSSSPELRAYFWQRVARGSGCWVWTGYRVQSGYGKVNISGHVSLPAHRVSWLLRHGADPWPQLVLHHCDNPSCVRPEHLFLGDCSANIRDAVSKGRFHQGFRHRPACNKHSPETWVTVKNGVRADGSQKHVRRCHACLNARMRRLRREARSR